MNMLIEELQMLAAQPSTWIVVALMAAIAAHSLIALKLCPYATGREDVSPEEAAEAAGRSFSPGLRFGMMMVAGIALTLSGLFMIAYGIKPTIALGLLVLGVVVVQTEPARLRIRESTNRVIAMNDRGGQALLIARQRLQGDHRELVIMNVVLLFALIAALLTF